MQSSHVLRMPCTRGGGGRGQNTRDSSFIKFNSSSPTQLGVSTTADHLRNGDFNGIGDEINRKGVSTNDSMLINWKSESNDREKGRQLTCAKGDRKVQLRGGDEGNQEMMMNSNQIGKIWSYLFIYLAKLHVAITDFCNSFDVHKIHRLELWEIPPKRLNGESLLTKNEKKCNQLITGPDDWKSYWKFPLTHQVNSVCFTLTFRCHSHFATSLSRLAMTDMMF